MAQIFVGADRRQIDPEVLEAFKTLPDEFWVFAEFTLSRNIDWFIVHPDANGTLALIVIELKRTGQPFAGDINSVWKQWTPEGWRELLLSGPYRNYYWQAVEAANKLKEWLWNNQRRYRTSQDLLPQDAFKIWPDLLILSPPGTNHQLPLQPPNNFGKFLYSLEECLRHIATWKSRQLALAPLVPAEMLRLAEALGLEQIWPPAERQEEGDLVGRVQRLEERVRRLEAALHTTGGPLANPGPPSGLAAAALYPSAMPDWTPSGYAPVRRVAEEPRRAAPPPSPPNVERITLTAGNTAAPPITAPPTHLVIGWIEDFLRQHGQGQPVRFADIGNALKSRHDFDARLQLGIPLSDLMQQAQQAGRVRLSYHERVPYAALNAALSANGAADEPPHAAAPPPTGDEIRTVRQKLGREGLMAAVRIIAAAEEALGGRIVQTASLLRQLRESLPLNGGPLLEDGEVERLLGREFLDMDYLTLVPVSDLDLDSGNLYRTDGYRLNRAHPAIQAMLDMGEVALNPDVEVRAFADAPAEVPLAT